jgi:hypothetical protein
MNAADLSQLRHLAEKVYDAEFACTPSGLDYFWLPATDGRKTRRVFSIDGWDGHPNQPIVWNPLEDANDCRELMEKLDKPHAIHLHGSWAPVEHRWHALFVDPRNCGGGEAYGPTEERAKCLAAARMTGW